MISDSSYNNIEFIKFCFILLFVIVGVIYEYKFSSIKKIKPYLKIYPYLIIISIFMIVIN
jgi:hypothetical protein